MVCGLTIVNNAFASDPINWIYFPFAALLIFFSLKNVIWLFRNRVVIKESEIMIHLPFAFFKPIQFDGKNILSYGELTETDKDFGIYKLLRVLDENGKMHEVQSYTVPEYDEIISFLKKYHIKNLGMKLFEEELKRRRKIKKKFETFFTLFSFK